MIQSINNCTPDDFNNRRCKGLNFVQHGLQIGENL